MSTLAILLWTLVLIGTIGIRALTGVSLYRAGRAAGLDRPTSGKVAGWTTVVLLGWLAACVLLAYYGAFASGPLAPVLVVALLVAVLAGTRIPIVAKVLAAPGTAARLAWPQTVRVIGVLFLILMFTGNLSPLAALPPGLGDLAIGLAAPWVARALARGTGHRWAFWFNVLGIADLTFALALRLVSGFVLGEPAGASGALPLALIPTAAVPLAVALHVVSLRRLAAEPRRTEMVGAATT
ncbi:hypothetical protein ACQPXB_33595 [Amycolatopsis sp. CA-161197]|uniref:hypothetical protein n=1 Tax=unclassified Amycolatopsis TaxID=2618356 RepID=UPI00345328BA